ncbi:MAG: sulfatase-like hydrolase/transferase, partial [Candidatus Levybacteria bacterium]|nr:sulfatase-like hydrolase/transferase [Candidatus Levybacteria bacterium]
MRLLCKKSQGLDTLSYPWYALDIPKFTRAFSTKIKTLKKLHKDPLFIRIGVIVLIFSIILTVYLAMQEQNLRQEAKGKGGGKPNIIVIKTDDQRFDLMDELPAVTKDLAKDGVTFMNAYTTTPLCCPSRSSFLTGEYAHNHGVWNNKSP